MMVTIINEGLETVYYCDHLTKLVLNGTPGQKAAGHPPGPGVVVTLFPGNRKPVINLRMPEDGQMIFVVDPETGKTTSTWRWPPPEKGIRQ